MEKNQEHECLESEQNYLALKVIEKYQNHSSFKLIKAKNKNQSQTFRFRVIWAVNLTNRKI